MKKTLIIVVSILFMSSPLASLASHPNAGSIGIGEIQEGGGGIDIGKAPIDTQTGNGEISDVVIGLVNWFAWLVALFAVIFGLYSGMLFVTSSGDDVKLKKARDTLIYTIIGVIVAILAFSIVNIARSIGGFVPII